MREDILEQPDRFHPRNVWVVDTLRVGKKTRWPTQRLRAAGAALAAARTPAACGIIVRRLLLVLANANV